jgi:hypothetical protein
VGTRSCNRCGTDTAVQSISSNNKEREGEGYCRIAIENNDNRGSDKEGQSFSTDRCAGATRLEYSGAAGPDKYEVSGQVIPSCQSRGSSRLDFQHSQVSLIIEIRGDDFLNNTPKFSLVLFKLPR